MSSTVSNILNNLVEVLREAGEFASVELGGNESNSAVPRAVVIYENIETIVSDSNFHLRYHRVSARILIRVHSPSPTEATTRLADLATIATDTIMADPYRDGNAHDLPIGKATEIFQVRTPKDQRYPERITTVKPRRPEYEIVLGVRCHYSPAGGDFPVVKIDDVDLFSSGPSEIVPGSWARKTIHRGLVGLDGEVVVDLGKRSRTIVQRGRLEANSSGELESNITVIEALIDGQTHTLVDAHLRTYSNVLVEEFSPQSPVTLGKNYWCDYRITYRQLP